MTSDPDPDPDDLWAVNPTTLTKLSHCEQAVCCGLSMMKRLQLVAESWPSSRQSRSLVSHAPRCYQVLLLRRLVVGNLMVASQGGAIWLWIATRPFAWWPTLRLTLGPRVRIFLAAGAAAFVPARGLREDAAAAEGVAQLRRVSEAAHRLVHVITPTRRNTELRMRLSRGLPCRGAAAATLLSTRLPHFHSKVELWTSDDGLQNMLVLYGPAGFT